MEFTKVEGLGNDFVLVDCREGDEQALAQTLDWARAQASGICDRRRGVGADGLLLVGPARGDAEASMTVVNFDGSVPEMCGNGLRCVAAHLAQTPGQVLRVATGAGPLRCEIVAASPEGVIEVGVDMGPARALGESRPAAGEGRRFLDVSMGNPHAVCFVAPGEDPEALARRLGPGVEVDPAYLPSKTNVEFAAREEDEAGVWLRLWVWERGVGITEACGTGACATAAAAVGEGLAAADTQLRVRLPGGLLSILVPSRADAGVFMRGPARRVFAGVL
ncbi:diaminopimelate epimerase [Pseudenhygromyxa sp. WMMC2535]|uniref:diaminopimelate epimerase n=1 Tax=Pseudenhygromyxa sp. WMMC2535 TaxID=2712867 RepID=UPI001C3DB1F4|nr:diaminopimelate epimerase [Pseudenhygromyxa sp. WMMC2535]